MNENKNLWKLGYRFNFKKYFTFNINKLKFTDYFNDLNNNGMIRFYNGTELQQDFIEIYYEISK
jgi:isocitrate lyase